MKNDEKDNVIYSFSPGHIPVAELEAGEILVVETADSFNGQIQEWGQDLGGVDWNRVAPATGPFFVSGAEPGDALEIDILEITPGRQGVAVQVPKEGVLAGGKDLAARVYALGPGGLAFADGISLSVEPMICVIGVAPGDKEVSSRLAGPHGGSLWAREIRTGSKLYLPVFVPGALFALGDVLLYSGEGAVSGGGIGASATIRIKVEVVKGMKLPGPQIATEGGTFFLASAPSLTEAARLACHRGVDYVAKTTGLPFDEAYIAVGAVGRLSFSHGTRPPFIAKLFVPRLLKALPGE